MVLGISPAVSIQTIESLIVARRRFIGHTDRIAEALVGRVTSRLPGMGYSEVEAYPTQRDMSASGQPSEQY